MSDLISRSELISALKVHFDSCFREDGELLYSDHICTSDDVADLIKLVKNQPTAYSIDKVIVELEKQAENTTLDFISGGYVAIDKAIEIVKQGGVDDDVCEWKLDGVYLHSQHNKPLLSCLSEDGIYRYNYCPYCGKRIKESD